MTRLPSKIFLILLTANISLSALACGPMYPYGEDVRFCFLHPETFRFTSQYQPFIYSSTLYNMSEAGGANQQGDRLGRLENAKLWKARCRDIPSLNDVLEVVYSGTVDNIKNSFSQYLTGHKDLLALAYLKFAKRCEDYNTFYSDPWERNELVNPGERKKLINEALGNADAIKDPDIKRRYAFLAMRLSFYNWDTATCNVTYNKYFAAIKSKNIVDHWAMYFYAVSQKEGALKNFLLAQVFEAAPDKRFMVSQYFSYETPASKTLAYAKTDKEKAAVRMVYAIRDPGKALEQLEGIHRLHANSDALDFLLLREVNKLEDWILTPYYTYFEGSLSKDWYYENPLTYEELTSRIGSDKAYAKELLAFIQTKEKTKRKNTVLWQVAEAYLHFLIGDYAVAEEKLGTLSDLPNTEPSLTRLLNRIRSLNATAGQQLGKATIPELAKQCLMDTASGLDGKFIFAIGRELEYKNNSTDAALLYSRIDNDYADHSSVNWAYWKTKKFHNTLFFDFFEDYFFYIDAWYEPQQIKDLISAIERGESRSAFDLWKFEKAKVQLPRLYDLLGTKYVRKNDMQNALSAFRNVNDTLWTSESYPYAQYLDANTFYTNLFNEHETLKQDSTRYNKREIVEKLLEHLAKAKDKQNANRAYDYFLAANCYLNMSQYGNSWMMRRYYWTNSPHETKLEDDEEYYGCLMAERYYKEAEKVAKNDAFAALCLRMAGRCEKYRLLKNTREDPSLIFSRNKNYKMLKDRYPQHYEELISNCMSFEKYFSQGRSK